MHVVQRNFPGKYTSIIIHNRYQIMEAWLSDQFYVFDHKFDDQIRTRGGEIMYFNSFSEAKAYIDQSKRK
jgi:hypothetical protein